MKPLIKRILKEYFDDSFGDIPFDDMGSGRNKDPRKKVFTEFKDYLGAKSHIPIRGMYVIEHGKAKILFRYVGKNTVELEYIKNEDKKGKAKELLEKFTSALDEFKFNSTLIVRDGETPYKRLVKIYQDSGYYETGGQQMKRIYK